MPVTRMLLKSLLLNTYLLKTRAKSLLYIAISLTYIEDSQIT